MVINCLTFIYWYHSIVWFYVLSFHSYFLFEMFAKMFYEFITSLEPSTQRFIKSLNQLLLLELFNISTWNPGDRSQISPWSLSQFNACVHFCFCLHQTELHVSSSCQTNTLDHFDPEENFKSWRFSVEFWMDFILWLEFWLPVSCLCSDL